MYIYKITNTITGQHYIGQTINEPMVRWKTHKKELTNGYHHNQYLQNAWNKYGADAFVFEPIGLARHQIELNELEDVFIKYYNSMRLHGYNLKTGGDNPIYSQDTKDKLSTIRKGKKQSQETKDKIRATIQQKYQDPEYKENLKKGIEDRMAKHIPKAKKPKVYKTEEEKRLSREVGLAKRRQNAKGAVYFYKKDMWQSRIVIKGKLHLIGYFKTEREASDAYHQYRITHGL